MEVILKYSKLIEFKLKLKSFKGNECRQSPKLMPIKPSLNFFSLIEKKMKIEVKTATFKSIIRAIMVV